MERPDIDTLEGNAYQSTIYVYSQLQDEYIDKLEKALERACKLLSGDDNHYECAINTLDSEGFVTEFDTNKSAAEWMNYLLKCE